MAPIPDVQVVETQSATIIFSAFASAVAICLMVLAVVGCGCCKKQEGKDEAGADAKAAEQTRKAPPSAGVTGGNRMYRTMMAVDKEDFVPSDKKEPTQKKKEAGNVYVELGGDGGGSVKKSEKKMSQKKKDFASGRDPAYQSLMGVDDKFEPSNKGK